MKLCVLNKKEIEDHSLTCFSIISADSCQRSSQRSCRIDSEPKGGETTSNDETITRPHQNYKIVSFKRHWFVCLY